MHGLPSVGITHTAISVGTTSTAASADNAHRSYILLQNDSDADIYIKFGCDAALHEGIMLAANGGHYEASARFANLDIRSVFAIHEGVGSKTLLVTEG